MLPSIGRSPCGKGQMSIRQRAVELAPIGVCERHAAASGTALFLAPVAIGLGYGIHDVNPKSWTQKS
jgi:hypothetical protein